MLPEMSLSFLCHILLHSGQKKKRSAPEQGQNFPLMLVI